MQVKHQRHEPVNSQAYHLRIKQEMKSTLIRHLKYHASKHGQHDPPHIVAAQDYTVQRMCAEVPHHGYTIVDIHHNLSTDNSDLTITDPPIPELVLPANMSPLLRQIPKEHMSIIYDVARYPIGSILPIEQEAPQLDPMAEPELIANRIRNLCHRHLIRTSLNKTIDVSSNCNTTNTAQHSAMPRPALTSPRNLRLPTYAPPAEYHASAAWTANTPQMPPMWMPRPANP